jgi:hypothetical protein
MKKIIASAVGLMLVGGVAATTSAAVESQFGGYWRTRIFNQSNMTGEPARFLGDTLITLPANNDVPAYYRADNRTRLYYTAKFNDDFKFVNKFEFNSIWGDSNGGDIGADGNTFVVKNSYADFNLGMTNTKLGIHAGLIGRGFVFDDDFSGATVTLNFANVTVPLMYASVDSEDAGGKDNNRDLWAGTAKIKVGDALSVSPYVAYNPTDGRLDNENWYVGADVDYKMDALSAWGTMIFNFGTADNRDNSGWLLGGGVDGGMWWVQAFYATGDDSPFDGDNDNFVSAPGQSYYWSEIMGLGVFDNIASNGSPGNAISNIMAVGGGAVFTPMDKLKINTDAWYAALAEDNLNGDSELGFELDGKLTYALMDNLNAEFILAYLFAGDATGNEDVLETGLRVSLQF